MPVPLEDELDRKIDNGDEAARTVYRNWLADPGLKRLEVAKSAILNALDHSHDRLSIGTVVFRDCQEIDLMEPVGLDERLTIKTAISGVQPHRGGDTPIVESINAALSLVPAEGGTLFLVTDGKDTCGGDPCQFASGLAATFPNVTIDLLDITNRSGASCLAQATGGKSLTPSRLDSFDEIFRKVTERAAGCSPSP